jgi:hypothetical protein
MPRSSSLAVACALAACTAPAPERLRAPQPAPGTAVAAQSAPRDAAPAPDVADSPGADAGADALLDAGLPGAPTSTIDAGPGEHWSQALRTAASCDDYRSGTAVATYHDLEGPKRKFGYDGYVFRQIGVTRTIDGAPRTHCVRVHWPAGDRNADGKRVSVGARIDDAWLRLIERTLARIPWRHVQEVSAFVIDDRPILHGVAPFDRGRPSEDARDGHTIWLHEQLFTQPNHWAHGNYGYYWSYHTQRDGVVVDGQPADHDHFSPVLLHEIGHVVNYNVVNGSASDPSCPPCAAMCGDLGTCGKLGAREREAPCVTAYCRGFEHASGTENWAEMYRWYYQGAETRGRLASRFAACFEVFEGRGGGGINAGAPAPWEAGLGQVVGYRRTRWDSCGGRACKPY